MKISELPQIETNPELDINTQLSMLYDSDIIINHLIDADEEEYSTARMPINQLAALIDEALKQLHPPTVFAYIEDDTYNEISGGDGK